MPVFAIADPHLSFGTPKKSMEAFGPLWINYTDKMKEEWKKRITKDDLVLIAGDISWALKLQDALVDLQWIDDLPGTKVMIKGNHDFWWSSPAKMEKVMPSSIHFIQNNVFNWQDISIGGVRLWDTPEYNFSQYVEFVENPLSKKEKKDFFQTSEEDEKIFVRDLERLKLSLAQLDKAAKTKIAMTHYPPLGADLKPSRASQILEQFGVNICVFGHLHSLKKGLSLFGEARGIKYYLTSCDYLDFTPIQIL
jgi:predicted phosphohydrolase